MNRAIVAGYGSLCLTPYWDDLSERDQYQYLKKHFYRKGQNDAEQWDNDMDFLRLLDIHRIPRHYDRGPDDWQRR